MAKTIFERFPDTRFVAAGDTAHMVRRALPASPFAPGETYCGGTGYRTPAQYADPSAPGYVTQYCDDCVHMHGRDW